MRDTYDFMANNPKKRTSKASAKVERSKTDDMKAQSARFQERFKASTYKTQSSLAKASGLSTRTINSYWMGHRGMKYDKAKALAAALGNTTPEYLLTGEEAVINLRQGQNVAVDRLSLRLFELKDFIYLRKIQRGEFFTWKKTLIIESPETLFGPDFAGLLNEQIPAINMGGDASMEPTIPRNAKVVAIPGGACESGKPVVALLEDLGIVVIRTLVLERRGGEVRRVLRAASGSSAHPDYELHEGDAIWPVRAQFSMF
jgi:transcriptional regulator with XRE-family HTH domain